MNLGLEGRVVVVAAEAHPDRASCGAALTAEGCHVRAASSLAEAETEVDRAVQVHGRIDGVVLYAPQSRPRDASSLEELYDSWRLVEAAVAAFQHAAAAMTQRGGGRLVTVIPATVKWLSAELDEPGTLAGLGVLGMHKSAVADIAPHRISANAVLRAADSDPDEVSATVAFLLSGSAGYLQGVTISLDGAVSPAMF